MIDPKRVTQIIVIDYSAKGYPFFELFVSGGRDFDRSSGQCFYTEDENQLILAETQLRAERTVVDFLNSHPNDIYTLAEATRAFGQIHWDELGRVVYNAAEKTFTVFTTKAEQYSRKIFADKNEEAFASWMLESERVLASTPAENLICHKVSVLAFKNSRMYRCYRGHFDQYVSLYDLDVRQDDTMPSILKLIDAISKNKHVLNVSLIFEAKKVLLGVSGFKYELRCTEQEYCCDVRQDLTITGKTCDEFINKIATQFLQQRLISVGY